MTLITATAPALIWGCDLVRGEDFSSKNLRGAVCPPRPAASPPEDIYGQMKRGCGDGA